LTIHSRLSVDKRKQLVTGAHVRLRAFDCAAFAIDERTGENAWLLRSRTISSAQSFAKIAKIIDIPNLIDIQKQSYEKFLQKDMPVEQREDLGLQGVFKSVFPIKDFSETSSIEFVSYTLDKPKYDVDECRQRA